jgi:hypothetical protein
MHMVIPLEDTVVRHPYINLFFTSLAKKDCIAANVTTPIAKRISDTITSIIVKPML